MNNNENGGPTGLAANIRQMLENARDATSAPPENTSGARVTKDGRIVEAGAEAPLGPDGNPLPTTLIPSATFHLKIYEKTLADFMAHIPEAREEEAAVLMGKSKTTTIVTDILRVSGTERSAIHVHVDGNTLEAQARAVVERRPDAVFLGYGHLHFAGLDELSQGDKVQVQALLKDPRIPAEGLLMLLFVRKRAAPPTLRAWRFTQDGGERELTIELVNDKESSS